MSEFSQYREISNGLKKRFNLIRKPNLKEASDSYRKLAQQLQPFPNYSGYCLYSAAKCEHQIVGSLKEQLKDQTTTISPGTVAPPSKSAASRANQALENLVHEALWTEFQTWLDAARRFREIDPMESDVNGAVSAYAHAIQTCPSPRILTAVLGELGGFYVRHLMFYEGAEVYIEAGLFREAIDCLLRGHFYQDAYHCYQEMFKKQPNFENYTNLTDVMYSARASGKTTAITGANSASDQQLQKSSILSLFKKKSARADQPTKPGNDSSSSKPLPPLQACSPFDHCENHLTVDDYINFFLLRLYLYDPVKYEYPSPIIPIPDKCRDLWDDDLDRKDHDDDDDDDDNIAGGTGGAPDLEKNGLLAIEMSLPFFDMINDSSQGERSVTDLIELNHLLETLYLSYRNELRPSIDNEYSEYDVIRETVSEQPQPSAVAAPPQLISDDSTPTTSSSSERFTTRYDSKDSSDDDQLQQTRQSPALKLFETGELDEISARLKVLALKCEPETKTPSAMTAITEENTDLRALIDRMEADWMQRQQAESLSSFENDDQLRQQIAQRLYLLLNGKQIQLLYDILEQKD